VRESLMATALVLAILVGAAAGAAESELVILPPLGLYGARGELPDPASLETVTRAIAEVCAEAGCATPGWSDPGSGLAPAPKPLPSDLIALKERASAALRDVDYQAAIRLHRQLVEALEQRLVEAGDVGLLVEAHLGLAQLYLSRRETMLVRASLERVARLRPGLSLDLRRHPPKLVERFEEVKARVAAEPKAQLSLTPKPAGAVVFVDGISMGKAPAELPVAQGQHLIWIGAPGHQPVLRAVEVDPGSRVVVDPTLSEREEHVLRGRLRRALESGAGRGEAISLAHALRAQLGAEAVVVTALAPIDGGLALIAALADEPSTTVVGRLDPALQGLGPLLDNALRHLRAERARGEGGLEQMQGSGAPSELAGLRLDFDAHLLGVKPVVVASTASGDRSPVVTTTPPPPDEEGGLLSSAWFWIGTGAVVVAVAGGVAGGLAYLLQPEAEVIEEPDRTTLDVEVVP